MVDGILIAALAALVAAFFIARAYNAHRERRLARMERALKHFADMSQVLLRSHFLNARQVGMVDHMLQAFRGDRHGWLVVGAFGQRQTKSDPATIREMREMPEAVIDGLALTIDAYYQYIIDSEPLAGFVIKRQRRAMDREMLGDKKQNEMRTIGAFQAAFDRRHFTPA